jgi:hypothetical protein
MDRTYPLHRLVLSAAFAAALVAVGLSSCATTGEHRHGGAGRADMRPDCPMQARGSAPATPAPTAPTPHGDHAKGPGCPMMAAHDHATAPAQGHDHDAPAPTTTP